MLVELKLSGNSQRRVGLPPSPDVPRMNRDAVGVSGDEPGIGRGVCSPTESLEYAS